MRNKLFLAAAAAILLGSLAATAGAARPGGIVYSFVGKLSATPSGGHVSISVESGSPPALRAMLGQPVDQTFSYDDGTIFLLWQGRVPTVIEPSQLKAGDRITVRVRAPQAATLAQVEATPASHVGDHEPGVIETKNA